VRASIHFTWPFAAARKKKRFLSRGLRDQPLGSPLPRLNSNIHVNLDVESPKSSRSSPMLQRPGNIWLQAPCTYRSCRTNRTTAGIGARSISRPGASIPLTNVVQGMSNHSARRKTGHAFLFSPGGQAWTPSPRKEMPGYPA